MIRGEHCKLWEKLDSNENPARFLCFVVRTEKRIIHKYSNFKFKTILITLNSKRINICI